jgi:hypothetical protein
MSDTEQNNKHKTSAKYGLIGLVLGMLALATSVGHFWLGPIEAPPALEDTIADKAVKIRNKVAAKLIDQQTIEQKEDIRWGADRIATATIAGISVLAIILSVIGFVRHEPIRIVSSGAALAGIALGLQYFVMAITAIVFAIILGAVISAFNIG